jgi:hypothetical protein
MSGKRDQPEGGGFLLPPQTLAPPRSGNDIRRDLVFDEGDAVAQLQLALLQPLQPQQIRRRRLVQRVDRRIEIAMLLLQPGKLVFELALIFVGHGCTLTEKRDEVVGFSEAAGEYRPCGPGPQAGRVP